MNGQMPVWERKTFYLLILTCEMNQRGACRLLLTDNVCRGSTKPDYMACWRKMNWIKRLTIIMSAAHISWLYSRRRRKVCQADWTERDNV